MHNPFFPMDNRKNKELYKMTRFKIQIGDKIFYDVLSYQFSQVVTNEDMSINIIFAKNYPVVFKNSNNPAERVVITLENTDEIDDIHSSESPVNTTL